MHHFPKTYSFYTLFSRLFLFSFICLSINSQMVSAMNPVFQQLSDEEMWQQAQKTNTESSYQMYVSRFPNGKYVQEAAEAVFIIRDNADWEQARKANTRKSYQDYLNKHPDGSHNKEAKRIVSRLGGGSSKSTSKVVTNNPPKNKTADPVAPDPAPNPAPKVVEEPKANTSKPVVEPNPSTPTAPSGDEEEKLWAQVKDLDTPDAYKLYLDSYPMGAYVDNALKNIPMEISYNRDNQRDTVFFLEVKYALAPIDISRVEIIQTESVYVPGQSMSDLEQAVSGQAEEGVTKWPEGKLKAMVTPVYASYNSVEVSLGLPQTYKIFIKDAAGDQKNISIEGGMQPLRLQGVNGRMPEEDSVFMIIKGGQSPFFARFVKPGKEPEDFIHEEELNKYPEPNTWYMTKNNLVELGKVEGGSYNMYIVDSRKTEFEEYNYDVFFKGGKDNLMEMAKGVLPFIGILFGIMILYLIFFRRKKRKSGPGYGYKGYR